MLGHAVQWVAEHTKTAPQTVSDGKWPHIEGWGLSLPYSFFILEDGSPCLAHNSHRDESANHLAMRYCYAKSYEATATNPTAPQYITDEFINSKVEELLTA